MSQIGVQSLTTPTQEHGPSRSDDEGMEIEDQEDTGQDVGQDVEVITQPPRESINGLESVQTTASQPEIPVSTLHAILPSFTSTLVDVAAQQSPDEFRDGTNVKKAAKRQQPLKSPEESLLKSPVREDDAQCCPICFEPWSNSGVHRLASLACGHLFGRSCIERWLKAKSAVEKCPQCNAPARRKDIRNIYAKALKTIDTTERDRALADLEKEKSLRQKAEEAEARALLQYQLVKVECERLKTSLVQQQELLIANSQAVGSCTCRKVGPKTVAEATCQSFTSSKCYVLQRSCQISKGGSRVMAFDEHHAVLVISKQSSNQLYPGFGIAKVSSLDIKRSEFVQIHQKPIRDATFSNQGDGLLLTASMDKTLKITSLLSNTVVQSYNTPTPAWSCAWNNSDNNYMYCGLQNGSCLMFDVRNTSTYLKNLVKEGDTMCPVISLAHVMPDPNSSFRPGGVIVCKLGGACFWESTFGVDYVCHPLTLPEGSFTRLSYEPLSRHCMFSLRPTKHNNNTRHMVCQLQGNGIAVATARSQNEESPASQGSIISCNPIAQCTGGSIQKLLSRSILFTNPDNSEKLIVAAPDEGTKAVLLWDGESGHKFQKLPNQTDAVVDVLPFSVNGQNFLTSITEQKLDVYMWQ